jgi:REP element-mobilizing transposase RayT
MTRSLKLRRLHIIIAIPPKYAVSQVVGFIKGKSAIYLARPYEVRFPLFFAFQAVALMPPVRLGREQRQRSSLA